MAGEIGAASLGHFHEVVGVRAIDVLRRRENEDGIRRHLAEQIHGTFDVRPKNRFGLAGILAEMRCEMNDYVVRADARGVERAKYVEMCPPRKIFRVEEAAHVRAEITAATCD